MSHYFDIFNKMNDNFRKLVILLEDTFNKNNTNFKLLHLFLLVL